jgi:hypothetical protein
MVDGAFLVLLNPAAVPRASGDLTDLSGKSRGRVECRAGEGPWVRPGETLVAVE